MAGAFTRHLAWQNFQHRFVFPVKTCSVSSCKHVIFDIAVGSMSLVMVFGNAIFVYSATHTFLINMHLREHRSFAWFSYKCPMRIRHVNCFSPHSIALSAVASCVFTLWEGPHAVKFSSTRPRRKTFLRAFFVTISFSESCQTEPSANFT